MRPSDYLELGVVKIATPCSESWEGMEGDDVKRFCTKCQLHVWNFAGLSTDEARELLIETEGRMCGRIFTRADGTVLTKDCPAGVARARRKRVAGAAAAAGLLGGALTAAVAAFAPGDACSVEVADVEEPTAHEPAPLSPVQQPVRVMAGGMKRLSSAQLAELKKQQAAARRKR